MYRLKVILLMALALLIAFQANIHAAAPRQLLKDTTIDEVAWAPNELKFIAKPFRDPAYLISRKNNTWEIMPLHIRENAKFFTWAHKSYQLLFWKDGNLFYSKLVDMASDAVLVAKTAETEPSWSPDDKYFAYISDNNVWICSTDLKQKKKVTKRAVNEAIYPQWSNSGKDIIFQGAYKDGYTIYKVNVATGETKVINDKLRCVYYKLQTWNDQILVIDETTYDFKVVTLDGKVGNVTNDGVSGRNIVQYGPNGLYFTDIGRNLCKLVKGSPRLVMKEVDYASVSPRGTYLTYSVSDKFYIADNPANR